MWQTGIGYIRRMSDSPDNEPTGPKDEHKIRKALNAIRSGVDVSTPAGQHAGGMAPSHPVLIASSSIVMLPENSKGSCFTTKLIPTFRSWA